MARNTSTWCAKPRTLNLDDLEWDEAMRIRFAIRHFAIAPCGVVDFINTTAKAGLRVADDSDHRDGVPPAAHPWQSPSSQ